MKRALLLLVAGWWLATTDARASDWVFWRGPEQTGVSQEKDLPDRWSPDPKEENNNLVWKQPYGGRSTPIIMNGRVYLINSSGEGLTGQERILCFDADSGKVLWEKKFNVFLADIDILRVGWTQLVGDPETGNIYAHGTQGYFMCLDGKTGKVLWRHSLTEEYGRIAGYGGRLSSPVIDGDLVIIGNLNASWGDQARPGNRWLAVNKRTGVPVWWSASPERPKDTYASVPVIAEINGDRLLITGGGEGYIHALRVQTGEPVWKFQVSAEGLSSSPVVHGNLVYICHGGANEKSSQQGRIVCLDASKVEDGKPKLVWEKYGIRVRYTSPMLHDGKLYVPDEIARLFCFDAATGKELWRHKYGRNAKGSPVWADGKIYIAEVNSKFHILKPSANGCKELNVTFFPAPDGVSDVELNGNPAVANRKVYFSTSFETYCIGKKDHKAATESTSNKAAAAAEEGKPSHLQIVPADVLLSPGQNTQFKARLFDDRGHFLKDVEAKWSVAPSLLPPGVKANPPPLRGKITEDGTLTVDKMPPGQFGTVVAEAEGLKGHARVRVAPPLPIKADFSKVPAGATPGGWVNTQGKFVMVEKDGRHVLKKLSTNASPLFARAHAFIGKPDLTDYTIQADLLGTQKGSDMPDMGISANRYILVLKGNDQQLKIISWESTPTPRVDKGGDRSWKPDVWYRMKLRVEVHGDKALIRGKVWEREEQEPGSWSVEFEDPVPNRNGSPTLFAFVTGILEGKPGSEVFYDNVSVTPNKVEGE